MGDDKVMKAEKLYGIKTINIPIRSAACRLQVAVPANLHTLATINPLSETAFLTSIGSIYPSWNKGRHCRKLGKALYLS